MIYAMEVNMSKNQIRVLDDVNNIMCTTTLSELNGVYGLTWSQDGYCTVDKENTIGEVKRQYMLADRSMLYMVFCPKAGVVDFYKGNEMQSCLFYRHPLGMAVNGDWNVESTQLTQLGNTMNFEFHFNFKVRLENGMVRKRNMYFVLRNCCMIECLYDSGFYGNVPIKYTPKFVGNAIQLYGFNGKVTRKLGEIALNV